MDSDNKMEDEGVDKFGIGSALSNICGLLVVVAICVTCSGNWPSFFEIFK